MIKSYPSFFEKKAINLKDMDFRANQYVVRCYSARWPTLSVLLMPGWAALAQHSCLLVPVPLTERLARAAWVAEARADAP